MRRTDGQLDEELMWAILKYGDIQTKCVEATDGTEHYKELEQVIVTKLNQLIVEARVDNIAPPRNMIGKSKISEWRKQKCIELHERGYSYQEIADILDYSHKSSVQYHLQGDSDD